VKAGQIVEIEEDAVDPNISTPLAGVSGIRVAHRKEMKRDGLFCLSEERPIGEEPNVTLRWSVII